MGDMSQVRTTLHKGKRIIEIDFAGCAPGAFAPVIAEAKRALLAEPPSSVLALTCVDSVRFDPATVVEMQRFATVAMPFLKANAIVGVTGIKKIVFGGIKPLYKVPVELFDSAAAAKDWLAQR
jgi:hypothetical protein